MKERMEHDDANRGGLLCTHVKICRVIIRKKRGDIMLTGRRERNKHSFSFPFGLKSSPVYPNVHKKRECI